MIPPVTLSPEVPDRWRPGLRSHTSSDLMAWYHAVAQVLRPGAVVVEVGVAHGRSALWLAELLAALRNDQARIYAVDPWRWPLVEGDPGRFPDPFGQVLRGWVDNATDQELEHLCPIRASSKRAASLFKAHTVDLVTIDGLHDATSVAADVASWLPKVKVGGWLCGHDYAQAWPGVIAAVDRAFPARQLVGGTVWVGEVGASESPG